jgi:hypothetical protein
MPYSITAEVKLKPSQPCGKLDQNKNGQCPMISANAQNKAVGCEAAHTPAFRSFNDGAH